MSSKLVRRLLQQTAVYSGEEAKKPEVSVRQKRKLRERREVAARPAVEDDVLVSQQVQNLLFLDGAMAKYSEKQTLTSKRIKSKQSKAKVSAKLSSNKTFGNSRSSSSSGIKATRIPTFDKKRYNKRKEEKRIAGIAKLLKKNTKKTRSKK